MGVDDVKLALSRARFGIVSVAVVSVVATLIGVTMVHAGSKFALRYRDRMIAERDSTSQIIELYREKRVVAAAALDAGGNLLVATVTLLAGYWAPAAYVIAAHRGLVLGLVSVYGNQTSRFALPFDAMYYLVTLLLQQLPYILVAGAGVNLGLARLHPRSEYAGPTVMKVPREAWRDAARIYVVSLPLFAIASAFEFLAP